jgi:phosphatidylserine/phosphatidylglycerophosphate/cardiolipin synthase-like enzyme
VNRDRARKLWPLLALLLCSGVGCTTQNAAPVDAAPAIDATVGDAPIGDALAPDQALRDGGAQPVCDPYAQRDPDPEVLIGPAGLEATLLARINGAQQRIDVMMYQLYTRSFADALIAAHHRGLAVRVLLDGDQRVNANNIERFEQAAVPVRTAPEEFSHAHAKLIWIDGTEAVVMSGNLNDYTMNSERNYGVIDRDPGDLAQLAEIFERDWQGSGTVDLSCTRLIVSPQNAVARINALVDGAQRTLDLAVMYISDRNVRRAVIARHEAGIAVRVLLANPAWIDSNAETAAELAAAGVPVKYLTNVELHAKLIIADDVALVGSQNLSYTSLNRNRELGVLVSDPDPVARIAEQFATDWQAGVSP